VENERRFEVQRQRDSIAMIEQQRIQRNLKAIDEERNRRKRRTAFFSAGSCFTVSVLLAGMGMFQYVIAGQYYEHFKEAAAAGDLSKYNIYKQKTDKANMSVLSSGIISGLCFTAGCTISIKAFGKKKRS